MAAAGWVLVDRMGRLLIASALVAEAAKGGPAAETELLVNAARRYAWNHLRGPAPEAATATHVQRRAGRGNLYCADGDHRPPPLRPQGGGGGGGGGKSPARELLDTLLLWNPRVVLDAKGQAVLKVPLNDALTSFRIVAVATMARACSAPAAPPSAPRKTCS